MTWDRAEEIARRYDRSKVPFRKKPRVPYLFEVAHWYVLVHRGKVITEQGTRSLGRYLSQIPGDVRRAMQTDDLVALVDVLGAFPPVEGSDPMRYLERGAHPGLEPTLEWTGDTGRFRLFYDVTTHAGESEDPQLRSIVEWTLTIAPDGTIAWEPRRLRYHFARNEFVN